MQERPRFLDDMSRLFNDAAGAARSLGKEAESMIKAQGETLEEARENLREAMKRIDWIRHADEPERVNALLVDFLREEHGSAPPPA